MSFGESERSNDEVPGPVVGDLTEGRRPTLRKWRNEHSYKVWLEGGSSNEGVWPRQLEEGGRLRCASAE